MLAASGVQIQIWSRAEVIRAAKLGICDSFESDHCNFSFKRCCSSWMHHYSLSSNRIIALSWNTLTAQRTCDLETNAGKRA